VIEAGRDTRVGEARRTNWNGGDLRPVAVDVVPGDRDVVGAGGPGEIDPAAGDDGLGETGRDGRCER
jgi:hypothetical protein